MLLVGNLIWFLSSNTTSNNHLSNKALWWLMKGLLISISTGHIPMQPWRLCIECQCLEFCLQFCTSYGSNTCQATKLVQFFEALLLQGFDQSKCAWCLHPSMYALGLHNEHHHNLCHCQHKSCQHKRLILFLKVSSFLTFEDCKERQQFTSTLAYYSICDMLCIHVPSLNVNGAASAGHQSSLLFVKVWSILQMNWGSCCGSIKELLTSCMKASALSLIYWESTCVVCVPIQ